MSHPSPLVRQAAIASIVGLVPSGQRTLLLGPLLEDDQQSVRFAAANALLGLSPDTLGLYFGPLQLVLDEYVKYLKAQPESPDGWIQLARLYIHSALLPEAQHALEQALRLDPDNLPAVVSRIELLDKQGKVDDSRQILATQLQAHPESAYLQHALGMWLLHHGEREYALLGLSKAVELEPDNQDYRRVGVALVNSSPYPCPSAGRNRLHIPAPVELLVNQAVEADELTEKLLLRKLPGVGCL